MRVRARAARGIHESAPQPSHNCGKMAVLKTARPCLAATDTGPRFN